MKSSLFECKSDFPNPVHHDMVLIPQVPIVKLKDAQTEIKVDISFNTSRGVESAKEIKKYKKKFPCLYKLVMVIKHFLLQVNIGNIFEIFIFIYFLKKYIHLYLFFF